MNQLRVQEGAGSSPGSAGRALSQPETENHGSERKRLLIVDDEHLIADTLTTIMSSSGFDAWTAYSGEEAVGLAEKIAPHLLISDVMMPGINGVQTAMRVLESVPDCSIILFSGQMDTMDHLRAAQFRGHSFLAIKKPLHPVLLIRLVRDMLASGGGHHGNQTCDA